ncbi:uncharacterized protein L199_004488 [Kwoniella botswanensis]|uniref:uncharacterized protein n=1 Tax=Kwoniella botswanensis TaxID=1268659 RepID=UPI00315CC8C2
MPLPSASAVPSNLFIHPSRLANFHAGNSSNEATTSASSETKICNAQRPVNSGVNCVPLRPTVRKRRVPVWNLPLRPLSKTARRKKKAEDKKKAKFYGNFSSAPAGSASAFEVEPEGRPRKLRSAIVAEGVIKDHLERDPNGTGPINEEVPIQEQRRIDTLEASIQYREQRPSRRSSAITAEQVIREDAENHLQHSTGHDHHLNIRFIRAVKSQAHPADGSQYRNTVTARNTEKEQNQKKKKKDKGKRKQEDTESRTQRKDRKRKKQKDKQKRGKDSIELGSVLNDLEEMAMNQVNHSLLSGSNVQNAITIESSSPAIASTLEPHVSATSMEEEAERIEYGPRPPRATIPRESTPETVEEAANNPQQAETGPSRPRIYHVRYPVGGISYEDDGDGIFVDPETETPLYIWIDPALNDRSSLIKKIQAEGGEISPDHTEDETSLLLLDPSSIYLFDAYCHSHWLRPRDLERYQQRRERRGNQREEEPWQKKVILKAWWIDKCIEAGKFLGLADDWGGCRAGGPPPEVQISTEEPGEEEDGGQEDEENWQDENDENHEDNENDSITQGQAQEIEVGTVPEEIDAIEVDGDQQDTQADEIQPIEADHSNGLELEADQNDDVLMEDDQDINPVDRASASDTVADSPTAATHVPAEVIPQNPGSPVHIASDNHVNNDLIEHASPAPEHEVRAGALSDRSPEGEDVQMEEEQAQESSDPASMFSELKFWVDTTYPDRITLIKRIKAAGGELVTSYSDSTHVLIHNYKHSQWHSIVESLTKQGIWFLNFAWLTRTLSQSRKLPESEFAVVHGNPIEANQDKKPITHSRPTATNEPLLASEDLDEIFKREVKMLKKGGTVKALIAFLLSKYATYSEAHWGNLYHDWKHKKGRFAYLAATVPVNKSGSDKSSRSPSVTIKATPAKIKSNQPALSTDQIARILISETPNRTGMNVTEFSVYLNQKYPEYPASTWSALISNWSKRTGRFANFQYSQLSSITATKPTPSAGSNTVLPQATSQSSTAPSDFSNEDYQRIFSMDVKDASSKSLTAIGKELAAKHGKLHATTWTVLYSEWSRKTGQFRNSGNAVVSSEPAVPPADIRGSSISVCTKPSISSPTKATALPVPDDEEDDPHGSLATQEIARIFKAREEEFTQRKLTSIEIGLTLYTEEGIYPRTTWLKHWRHWRRNKKQFSNHPPDLQSTVAAKGYADASTHHDAQPSSSAVDAPALKQSSFSSSPKKRTQSSNAKSGRYDMEEEKAMSQYISGYKGSHPKTSAQAWTLFASIRPGRTASAYAQHYTAYAFRIDSFAPKHRAADKEEDDNTVLGIDVDDLIEPPNGSQSRPVEIEDDEDEQNPIVVVYDDQDDTDCIEVASIDD